MLLNFEYKAQNELEKDGRDTAPLYGEREIVCPNCHRTLKESEAESRMMTCICGHHFRIGARKRLGYMTDEGSFRELFSDICPSDPLSFPGYGGKLEKAREMSGEKESVITGSASIGGYNAAVFAMEPFFMMGSLGSAAGEKITLLFEHAAEHSLPVVGWTVSGGARMQEGMLSLMQMAKTSAAVKRHSEKGLLYITVLTDPTTGGVTASFAMEGDIILSEPGATVGFAGRRVIEETVRQKLPRGFQTSEFILEHGFADMVITRIAEKETISSILALHRGNSNAGI